MSMYYRMDYFTVIQEISVVMFFLNHFPLRYDQNNTGNFFKKHYKFAGRRDVILVVMGGVCSDGRSYGEELVATSKAG